MSRCFPFPPPDYSQNGLSFQSLQELLEMRRKEAKAERKRKKAKKRRKRMEGLDLEEGEILQKKYRRGENEVEKCETEDTEQCKSLCSYNSYGKSRKIKRNNRSWYSHGHYKHGSRTWTDFQVWPPFCANGSLQPLESQFGEYFMPGPMQFPNSNFEFDDHDWLYRRNRPNDLRGTLNNARSYNVCHGNSTLYPQPHAVYFPHVDIYAYPYALPY